MEESEEACLLFDSDETGPDIGSLKPKKEFECKNLPYVGFTYTTDKGKAKSLEKGENSNLGDELKAKVSDIRYSQFLNPNSLPNVKS